MNAAPDRTSRGGHSMTGSDVLQIIAEVGAAYAGFGSVVVVFQHRDRRQWSPGDLARFRGLLRLSLGAVLFALLPLALFHMGVPERTLCVVRECDLCAHGRVRRCLQRHGHASPCRRGVAGDPVSHAWHRGRSPSWRWPRMLWESVSTHSRGPYIAALVATLLVASVAFLQLVAYPGEP